MTRRVGLLSRLLELAAFLTIVAGFYDLCTIFISKGYLPAPFVFDVGDTFMDWFNTAYWAHRPGGYEVWNSIYAPLSFVITGLFGNPRCYAAAPYDARDCDWLGIVAIVGMYAASVVLSAIAFWRSDRTTAVFRSVGIALGGPMLFALERGNLIMLAYIAFVLLYGGFLRTRGRVALAVAAMINLKSYLLFPVMGLAAKREWRALELCGFATIGLYIVTLVWVGAGTPFELAHNLQVWFELRAGTIWDEVLYSTTYKPYLQFDVRGYPIRDYVPQRTIDWMTVAIQVEVAASRGLAILCVAATWFYPKVVPMRRLALFILMQSFLNQNPGGYAIAMLTFLVFLEPWKNARVGTAILCCYFVSIPTDVNLTVFYHFERAAWLSGRLVDSPYALPLGALIRPGLLAIMLWAMAIDTLIDVHRAMRKTKPRLDAHSQALKANDVDRGRGLLPAFS